MEVEETLLENEQLDNGVEVRFYDVSRRVAGDRWQVNVRCDALVPVAESFWSGVSGDADLVLEIRATLGSEIVFSNVKERNFVAEDEKEGVLAGMVREVRESALKYIAAPLFPERYFKSCFEKTREKIEQKQRVVWVPDNEDVEEPVDFSHLFSDVKKSG